MSGVEINSDSASEMSDNISGDEDFAAEKELEKQEKSYLGKKEAEEQKDDNDDNDEPAEYSDPEYGYNSEDSENERTLHTIGDVPLHWYEDFDHIGYDLEGEKVTRPKGEDAIDRFMALNETSSGWKSVYDEKTGKRVIISDRDMEYIKRLQSGKTNSRYDAENVRLNLFDYNTETRQYMHSKNCIVLHVDTRCQSRSNTTISFTFHVF